MNNTNNTNNNRNHTSKARIDEWRKRCEYYASQNPHQIAVEGVDSGAFGKAAEMRASEFFGCVRGKFVKKQGQKDLVKTINGKRVVFEIKTGAPQIACPFPFDAEIPDLLEFFPNVDYFIYCPYFYPTAPIEKIAVVVPARAFAAICTGKLKHCRTRAKSGAVPKINTNSNFADWFIANHIDAYLTLEQWYNMNK